ncbi:hypothetical protein CKN82_02755 [Carnobacterium divergens]|uniref:hypothetical protein n=1 Tax=Carnobacterium divergens TaxID=2748 RepID=UPI000E73E17F|nr:hypothetical protein [Carnobacterium divergens]ANZ99072.1 hypothetical protein BFC22_02655 [Carnobacterium divergens]MDT1997141.1 hypothetical protein [Carnobacterium divergens]MDT2011969.1 hypothetical protein [Carnobacterium divergens]TFI67583.1 hypothetical protein CKN59_03600 [Carnobacterium divergens]TFI67704.1 hypothetical protein CKN76_03675 [Carnobacterium divergens]
MEYPKQNNYLRSCLLFGSLFSFNVFLDLNVRTEVFAETGVYLYQVDGINQTVNQTLPVDPMNPNKTVEPLPPEYSPRVDQQKDKETEYFSVSPPNGKKAVLIDSLKVQNVKQKTPLTELNPLILNVSSEVNNGGGFGADNSKRSYLSEMYLSLTGSLLYGEAVDFKKEYLL